MVPPGGDVCLVKLRGGRRTRKDYVCIDVAEANTVAGEPSTLNVGHIRLLLRCSSKSTIKVRMSTQSRLKTCPDVLDSRASPLVKGGRQRSRFPAFPNRAW